ncbi:MAG: hypothetical protein RMH75_01325 [Archaeoglobaceae archaeon]|nr:hypothetical protein [Archaeoglobaceae archaeon]MDW7989301.1 hypothetical protein [Archaeoglobaceae archaeon]
MIDGKMIGKIVGKSIAGKSISLPFVKADIGEIRVIALEIGNEEIMRHERSRIKSPFKLNKI